MSESLNESTDTKPQASLVHELESLVGEVEDLLQAAAPQAGESFGRLRAQVQTRLEKARAELAAAGHEVGKKTHVAADKADDFVRQNPWESVGLAAAIGVIIGMILRRR